MNSLPVRIFHTLLSGAFLAIILCALTYQIQMSAHGDTGGGSTGGSSGGSGSNPPPPAPAPPPPPLNPTPDDLDGDRIPNAWEGLFHHEPNKAADAGSDFDNDGLTALQEYQLHQQTSGASGNPLGHWATETLQPPPELGISGLVLRTSTAMAKS